MSFFVWLSGVRQGRYSAAFLCTDADRSAVIDPDAL